MAWKDPNLTCTLALPFSLTLTLTLTLTLAKVDAFGQFFNCLYTSEVLGRLFETSSGGLVLPRPDEQLRGGLGWLGLGLSGRGRVRVIVPMSSSAVG